MLRYLLISAAFLSTLPEARPVFAEGFEEMVQAQILPGWREADGTHIAALHLRLAPGWKTFWRAPGEAGIPARFNLSGSDNLSEVTPIWPTPQVFDVMGMRTIGYEREVILPLRITAQDAQAAIALDGQIELGICSDVCVPATLTLTADLPPEGASDIRIKTAMIDVPYSADEAGVAEVECSLGAVQYGLGFRAEITMPDIGGDEDVVVEAADPLIWVAEGRSWREGDVLIVETEMSHLERPAFQLAPDDIRITVIGAGQAVDIPGCPAQADLSAEGE